MNAAWRPGDLGVATTGERFIVTRSGECAWDSIKGDVVSGTPTDEDRRLIVIDPEDVEQVWSLGKALVYSGAFTGLAKGNVGKIRAALSEFVRAAPPKPDEPTGLGAVVEDEDGQAWVRVDLTGAGWHHKIDDRNAEIRAWREVPAARVLSLGVDA